MPLAIEFDPAKDARNIAMRGISLAEAETLLRGFIVERQDERFEYGEIRIIATGEINGREFVCVYTRRGDAIRPISLRRADRKERDVYQQAKGAAARDKEA
jgi:uncharacterized DUF497 family protein